MSSYRLESSTRPRPPPPPPLKLQGSTHSSHKSPPSTATFLYELPPSVARSPPPLRSPPVPNSSNPLLYSPPLGPSSPPFSAAHHRNVANRRTPPPRPRSSTPSQPIRQDLDTFAAHCRAWYYQQDEFSGRVMTETLASLPSSQRAQYARLQANIRSSYHAAQQLRRTSEFHAHLTSTQPGQSLTPMARADPTSAVAQKERAERLERFIKAWCVTGIPGTKPFFEGLWGVLRLQALPEDLGGAGGHRIEWEIDDAVFRESAGKDFMLEAIDVLKGVLGFEESAVPGQTQQQLQPEAPAKVKPRVKPPVPARRNKSPAIASTTVQSSPLRGRAPSDPFLDPHSSQGGTSSPSPASSGSVLVTEDPLTPPSRQRDLAPEESEEDDAFAGEADPLSAPPTASYGGDSAFLRIWHTPDLSNPEINSLLALFPTFVTGRSLPRFPVIPKSKKRRKAVDIEEAAVVEDAAGGDTDNNDIVRFGTGRMWVGTRQRSEGYRGSVWQRFLGWWRRVFC